MSTIFFSSRANLSWFFNVFSLFLFMFQRSESNRHLRVMSAASVPTLRSGIEELWGFNKVNPIRVAYDLLIIRHAPTIHIPPLQTGSEGKYLPSTPTDNYAFFSSSCSFNKSSQTSVLNLS